MVDIYYSLYGTKKPLCLPNAELSAMFKPQKINFGTEPKSRPSSRPSSRQSSRPSSRPPSRPSSRPSSRPATPVTLIETVEPDVQFDDNFTPLPQPVTVSSPKPLDILDFDDDIIKLEDNEDEKITKDDDLEIYELNNRPINDIIPQPPPAKKIKTDYYSDNSVSLPGISNSSGVTGPSGFEGMFIKEDEDETKSKAGDATSGSKSKKKKKDKKKHKHKHKHKKNRDKDKDRSMDKKDPNITRILKEETQETLSSADSSSNSNMQTDLSMTM